MNRRTRPSHRSPPSRSEPFLKYLKPGALAQIRDSRMISARTHRTISEAHQIRATPPSSPQSTPGPPLAIAAASDVFPLFSGRAFGPRCPQRKKLFAAKSAAAFPPLPVSPVMDVSSEPVIDLFGGGGGDIVAH